MSNNKDFKVKNGIQPTVYHEAVGTVTSETVVDGYNVATSTYDSVSTSNSIHGNDNDSRKFFFNDDGTKVFIIGNGSGKIWEYPLSTAYDVSTIGTSTANTSVTYYGANSRGGFFKPDGTRFYSSNLTDDEVGEYILSTAWDVSTMSPQTPIANYVISLSTNVTSLDDVEFSSDGTVMVVTDIGGYPNNIKSYNLSTAWDVTTATYNTATSAFATATLTNPSGIRFSPDGLTLYIVSESQNKIHIATLTTAYDISTITSVTGNDSTSFDPTSQNADPYAVDFNSNGTKMYILGRDGNDNIYQYTSGTVTNTRTLDLSTGSVFEITPTSDIEINLSNPADSGTVSQATLLLDGAATIDFSTATYNSVSFSTSAQNAGMLGLAFSTDGTKMYTSGTSGSEVVYQYTLTTAWDLSTASYASKSFDVSTQVTGAYDVDFSSDGTGMYVMDNGTDTIYQYTLSTAWDVSTASYASKSFSVTSQESNPTGFTFNDDGSKLYVSGIGSNNTFQYDLSTAYDISTASYNNVFLFTGAGGADEYQSHRSLVFAQSGTKLFTLGTSGTDYINQFNLTTPYDISTGSYSGIQFDIDAVAVGGKAGFAFAPDNIGKFYIVTGGTTDTINEIDMTTSTATITYPSTLEFAGGTAPTSPDTGETDVLTISTTDGGTSYQAVQAIDGAS